MQLNPADQTSLLASQAHADNLSAQQSTVASEPAKVQVVVKARSLHAQAQSLEAQADAQTLQVRSLYHMLLLPV